MLATVKNKEVLQWLQTLFSMWSLSNTNSKRPTPTVSNSQQCYSTHVLNVSNNFNKYDDEEQGGMLLTITIKLDPISNSNNTQNGFYLCLASTKWQLEHLYKLSTSSVDSDYKDYDNEDELKGLSTMKIVLISFCGTILALFFFVVLCMRIRNWFKRRSKYYKDSYSPKPTVIYEDIDLNPRTEQRRQQHAHYDMQWSRYPQGKPRLRISGSGGVIGSSNTRYSRPPQSHYYQPNCKCPRCMIQNGVVVGGSSAAAVAAGAAASSGASAAVSGSGGNSNVTQHHQSPQTYTATSGFNPLPEIPMTKESDQGVTFELASAAPVTTTTTTTTTTGTSTILNKINNPFTVTAVQSGSGCSTDVGGTGADLAGIATTSTFLVSRRRRHSLVEQIESVMNKHFVNAGVNKTNSNDNLRLRYHGSMHNFHSSAAGFSSLNSNLGSALATVSHSKIGQQQQQSRSAAAGGGGSNSGNSSNNSNTNSNGNVKLASRLRKVLSLRMKSMDECDDSFKN